jgi:hypothetical protein
MFKKVLILLTWLAGFGSLAGPARPEFQVALEAGSGGLESFYVGIGDYYRVPEREVLVVRERRIPDDEIPVVFFLASRAHVAPGLIIDQRLSGMGWMDITLRLGLGPEIFYVPVEVEPGPPYGRAYGWYKHHPRSDWGRLRLVDMEVVDLVNLRFMTEHYGYRPEEVFRMRADGRHFHEMSASHGKKGERMEKGREEKRGDEMGQKAPRVRGRHKGRK